MSCTYQDICNHLAARWCYDAGQSLTEIARSAKRSKATVRRWIKITGLDSVSERKPPSPDGLIHTIAVGGYCP